MTTKNIIHTLEGFKAYTIKNEGFILSDGTLNNLHLLTKAYDFIQMWEITDKNIEQIKEDLLKCFKPVDDFEVNPNSSLFVQQYHDEIELKTFEEMIESYGWTTNDVWNEDIYNLFSRISPEGFYFGSSEGDGACIGWFKFEEEENEICNDCNEEFSVSELTKSFDHENEVEIFLCNDCFKHGNE